ncbi:MAG: tRNA (guanosine(37)-N1)-methyltransferase TrmD [Candidatus Paceibacterota bacterium]|nr:MAG: tRNA (guanosine(37)-N1)-methyltransferase TrmD [Candidatus Paceibacterota bacterium]
MTFHVITIFPNSINSYVETSVLRKAQEQKKVKLLFYTPRDFTKDKHRQVDDKPYGGGAGMVMKAEPILKTIDSILKKVKKNESYKIVILSAKGKQFDQKLALNYSKKYDHLILIAGRYEGIDERVRLALKAQEISIGPYVLTDGELPAAVLISTITRLIPGVIKFESLIEESFFNKTKKGEEKTLEYPHYTRPEVLVYKGKKYQTPKVLLSGDHKKINKWREEKKR